MWKRVVGNSMEHPSQGVSLKKTYFHPTVKNNALWSSLNHLRVIISSHCTHSPSRFTGEGRAHSGDDQLFSLGYSKAFINQNILFLKPEILIFYKILSKRIAFNHFFIVQPDVYISHRLKEKAKRKFRKQEI